MWMKMLRACLYALLLVSGPVVFAQPPQQTPPRQDEFVPVDQLPGNEQLPAAALVGAAYGVAWICILVYVWSIWRRLGRVDRELADVSRRLQASARR